MYGPRGEDTRAMRRIVGILKMPPLISGDKTDQKDKCEVAWWGQSDFRPNCTRLCAYKVKSSSLFGREKSIWDDWRAPLIISGMNWRRRTTTERKNSSRNPVLVGKVLRAHNDASAYDELTGRRKEAWTSLDNLLDFYNNRWRCVNTNFWKIYSIVIILFRMSSLNDVGIIWYDDQQSSLIDVDVSYIQPAIFVGDLVSKVLFWSLKWPNLKVKFHLWAKFPCNSPL